MTENERTERLLAETAWLQALAKSLVADRDVAADVAQETLLVAWRKRFAGVVEIRPWLATVARNLAKRMARSEGRRRRHEAQLLPRADAPATVDVVAKASMQRDVVDATLRLGEPYRTTLLLRFLEELGYEQIAARMAVPIETVRTRIKRGLKQLRATLDERHGGAKAWAVPILGVTGFQGALAHAAPVAAAGAAGGAVVAGAGVLLMSLQAKVVVAAVVMLAAVSAWQLWPQAEVQLPRQQNDAAAPSVAAASAGTGARLEDMAVLDSELQRIALQGEMGGPPDPAAAPAPGLWQLTGRVVDEASGAPLARAHVRLASSGLLFTPVGADQPAPEPVRSVDSDAGGRFTLPTNGESNELQIDIDGHAVAHIPLWEAMGRARLAQPDSEFFDKLRTVDLGDVLMPIGTQLSGRVLAADGVTPVPGARLAVCRIAAMVRIDEVGESGDDGSFVLSKPLAPDYGQSLLVAESDLNDQLLRGIGWRVLDVSRRASVRSGFDIVLLPGADVALRVVDDAGQPVAGASVTVMPLNFAPLGGPMPRVVVGAVPRSSACITKTDALGIASVGGRLVGPDQVLFGKQVPGGAYKVLVRAEGYRGEYREVLLRPGTNELTIVLPRGNLATVRGIVSERGDGRPIAKATVEVFSQGGRVIATSDEQGAFACEQVDLRGGLVNCSFEAHGYLARRTVEPVGGRSGDIELRVELDPAVQLTGIVVDQDEVGVADVPLWLGEQWGRTAGDGRFTFAAVPKALLLLRVVPSAQSGITQASLAEQQVDTRQPLEPLRIVLQRRGAAGAGTEVEFTIAESAAGRPLEPSMVALLPVDANGQPAGVMVPLEPFVGGARAKGVPSGRYQLRIETREGHRGVRTVEIPNGAERFAERIELDAPGSVAVTVDLSAVPAASRPAQLQFELSPWDAGHFGARNKKDVGDQRLFWFCLDLTSGSEFDLESVVPGAPCKLTVRDAHFTGELAITAQSGQRTTATLRVLPK